MSTILTSAGAFSKKNFAAATAVLSAMVGSAAVEAQVTTSWTGGVNNVWATSANWGFEGVPTAGSIALIGSGGTGDTLFLRESSNGGVSVGTLLFQHQSYRQIVGGTSGASAASISFGSSPGMDVNPGSGGKGSGPVQIGDLDESTGAPNVQLSRVGVLANQY